MGGLLDVIKAPLFHFIDSYLNSEEGSESKYHFKRN